MPCPELRVDRGAGRQVGHEDKGTTAALAHRAAQVVRSETKPNCVLVLVQADEAALAMNHRAVTEGRQNDGVEDPVVMADGLNGDFAERSLVISLSDRLVLDGNLVRPVRSWVGHVLTGSHIRIPSDGCPVLPLQLKRRARVVVSIVTIWQNEHDRYSDECAWGLRLRVDQVG